MSSPRSASGAFRLQEGLSLCTDDGVIGSAFYIMSMEEGRVFWDPTLPSQAPDARLKIFTSKIETLAQLHVFRSEVIGLGDFGKPGNYFARQVDRWTKQYRASGASTRFEFENSPNGLPKTVPEQKRVSIVHGDLSPRQHDFPRDGAAGAGGAGLGIVHAWRSHGQNFTYLLMQWTMPGLAGADLKALNIPSMEEAACESIATSPKWPCRI